MAVAKKPGVKRAPAATNKRATETAPKPTRKTAPVKKAAKKAAGRSKAVATRTAPAKRTETQGTNFRPGSDAEFIFHEALKGGTSRQEVVTRVKEHYKEQPTRNGGPKPVSTVLNQVIRRALSTGDYEIVESWKLRKIRKPVGDSTSAAPPVKSAPVKKAITRKAVGPARKPGPKLPVKRAVAA